MEQILMEVVEHLNAGKNTIRFYLLTDGYNSCIQLESLKYDYRFTVFTSEDVMPESIEKMYKHGAIDIQLAVIRTIRHNIADITHSLSLINTE